MKKVLVTGISGFVGQHLARHLVDNGFLVRGMGRLPKRQTTLSDVVDYIQVSDAQAVDDWDRYLKDCEVIVHLAAKVHEIEKTDNKDEYDLVNAVVTEKFAQAAAGHGVKKFVFLSTIKVNGEETFEKPFTEEDDPKPEGAYAKSKFKAEQALLRIQAETKMGVVIIRTPLVYGPGVKGNFLRLLWLAQKGVPLPLGRFQNVRHMISVGNLCDLIVHCLTNAKAGGNVFLASDAESVTVPDLIKMIAHNMGRPARIFNIDKAIVRRGAFLLGKKGLYQRLCCSLEIDRSKSTRLLGWKPPCSMNDALKETVTWYNNKAIC